MAYRNYSVFYFIFSFKWGFKNSGDVWDESGCEWCSYSTVTIHWALEGHVGRVSEGRNEKINQ